MSATTKVEMISKTAIKAIIERCAPRSGRLHYLYYVPGRARCSGLRSAASAGCSTSRRKLRNRYCDRLRAGSLGDIQNPDHVAKDNLRVSLEDHDLVRGLEWRKLLRQRGLEFRFGDLLVTHHDLMIRSVGDHD